MSAAGFWDDAEASQKVMVELKALKNTVDAYETLHQELEDEVGLLDMCDEARDREHILEARGKVTAFERRVEAVEIKALFTGKDDPRDVYLSIHAGAGGVDAMDWAAILRRMYLRWLAKQGYEAQILDELEGEEAGIKSTVLEVKGPYAFGYLKSETGVHRLVRLSPFDANHKRQTSFASVDVVPIHDDIEIDIKESELKIDTYSAGGPGGQHVNKTQSAVRITHLPTGTIVTCQNQRSQILNRKSAMKELASRLYQQEEAKRDEEFAKQYGQKSDIAFGSQIRSYTMQPYTLVKDERTGHKTGDVQAVLDGDLDPFIEGFLRWRGTKVKKK